jgi:1,4-alpha-glucan branching enzyme
VYCYLRYGFEADAPVVVALNYTPVARRNYRLGVPREGSWRELLNSDAPIYGGSGQGNFGAVESVPFGSHSQPHSVTVTLPPLGAVLFTPAEQAASSATGEGWP